MDQEVQMSDAEMDALVNGDDDSSTGEMFPMEDAPQAQPQPEQPAPQAQQQTQAPTPVETYTINWNGKQIPATKDQLIQWAQMGYDYPQRMAELKKQQEEYEKNYSIYKEIDQFAKQNPDWWKQVEELYKGQGQQGQVDPNNPISQELQQLKAQLNEFNEFKSQLIQKEEMAKRSQEDESLTNEIQSMREQYKHLDWGSVDQRGYDLEMQVLAYANENRIGNFKDAFKAYNHDRLMSLAAEQAKEAVVKENQKKTKLGLLGSSPTPSRQISEARSLKEKSYNDLAREALEELGIMGA